MLMHHADAQLDRLQRRGDLYLLFIYIDRALLRLFHSEQDLHQGRLAGAVLSYQGMNLALLHRERNPFICH